MAVLGELLLVAVWISGGTSAPESPAPILSRSFELKELPVDAKVSLAVDGWCEVRVNGRSVTDAVLTPVTCQPDKRVSSLSLDVRPALNVGSNVVEVLLGNGWKNTFAIDTWGFHRAPWRGAPRICGVVTAGGVPIVETDASWEAEDSPIVFNSLRNGEWYDARREGSRHGVRPVTVEKYSPWGKVCPDDAVSCKTGESFTPKHMLSAPDGAVTYDFGANISGWCEIEVCGERGSKVSLDYDESLTPSNTPLGYVGIYLKKHGEPRPVQHDEYTLAGRGDVERWHPRFAYHGFRYVRVKKEGRCELKGIRARFVHSAFDRAGYIRTSDPVFQALQDATVRSYLSNFVGIPTDCPHREKNGWTGDAHLACETGLWNFKAKDGYVHFLRMMLDAQQPNGAVPCILPCCPSFGFGWGSGPAWDALLFVLPRQVYRFTGDDSLAREAYEAQKRYMKFIGEKRDAEGLVEYGLGDWCYDAATTKPTPVRLTDSAWIYHFYCELAFWARRFGEGRTASEAESLAGEMRESFNRVFWRGDGEYAEGQWTALAAPLFFKGLCVSGQEKKVAMRLVEKVRNCSHRAKFGILGAKWVPRVLADYGFADDAWRLFVQPETPGWAAWLKTGDGTLMEHWDMTASHNHIMFGDLSAWAYEYVAGIVPLEPGFRKIAIRPHYLSGVESFSASYATDLGEVKVAWKRVDGEPVLTVSVPPGIERVE